MPSLVQHTVFAMSHQRYESWMTAMPLVSVWGHIVPSPLCCHAGLPEQSGTISRPGLGFCQHLPRQSLVLRHG